MNLDPRVPEWGLRPAERSLWAELWTRGCLGLGAGLGCGVHRDGPTPGPSFLLHFLLYCFQWK